MAASRKIALVLMLASLPTSAQDASGSVESGVWPFVATLDGQPIGTHRFAIAGTPRLREVDSHADFVVRFFGIAVYRYRFSDKERWEGDCLRALRSDTDDDGRHLQVDAHFDGECVMSFAYWNPRIVEQSHLVDPQSGRLEPVRFERVADSDILVHDHPEPARGWRLITASQRITVWYSSSDGRWIALDADVKGGRELGYRLPSTLRDSS